MKQAFFLLFLLKICCGMLYGQQQVLDAAPDLFEDYSEQQLEEWMDELQQLQAKHLNWDQSLRAIQQFPWVDMAWVRTRLGRLSEMQAKELLLNTTMSSPTIELLRWLHQLHLYKKSASTTQKPTNTKSSFTFAHAQRLHGVKRFFTAEHRTRLLFHGKSLEFGLNSSQSTHHEYQRWRTPQKLSTYLGYSINTSKLTAKLLVGRLQYQLGSGIIGNQRQRLFLTARQGLLDQRNQLKGSVQRASDRMLSGAGVELGTKKWGLILAAGFTRRRKASTQDTLSRLSEVTLGERWSDRNLHLAAEIPQFIQQSYYKHSNRFQISLSTQYLDLEKVSYANQQLSSRWDFDLGLKYMLHSSIQINLNALWYADNPQFLLSLESEPSQSNRFKFYVASFFQNAMDPFRRIPLLVGSTGRNRWLALQYRTYRNKRLRYSWLFSLIETTDQSNFVSISYQPFAEFWVPLRLEGKQPIELRLRWRNQADGNQPIQAQITHRQKLHQNWVYMMRMGYYSSIVAERRSLSNASSFMEQRLQFQNESHRIEFRFSNMTPDEQTPIQRMESWSMNYLIRDVLVRRDRSTAAQLSFQKKWARWKFNLALTYLWFDHNRLFEIANRRVYASSRFWSNFQLTYSW